MRKTILVVEDNKETLEMLEAALESDGFDTKCKTTVSAGEDFLARNRPDLIILDLVLPDGDGLKICEFARNNARLAKTPIIALTGLCELKDKKRGFNTGVDQYLEKPLEIEELLLWVKALLRRIDWTPPAWTLPDLEDLQICNETYMVRFQKTLIRTLTRREFDLLFHLVSTSPRIISRQGIISEIWKTVAVENLVDTHIHNLRRKLPPQLAARIQAVPGKGFRYFYPKHKQHSVTAN
ncbi:MAG: response regulator transcription factor [Elusimicrobiales bacterium]|nr:response regulator transcription factor [Elusimicrobiales bacterium]